MKKFSEQFKKKADGIRLRAEEKHELRERLLAYMEYHPLPESANIFAHTKRAAQAASWQLNGWMIGRIAGASLVFCFIFVPMLAEKALPGEILYPVKVRFNEEVRGALVSSPYEKIEWETERLERRLAEANLLADAGMLTPDAEADVARAVKQHSEAAEQSIADIRKSDSDDAALAEIKLSSALEVQSEVLDQREESGSARSMSTLATAVNEAKLRVNHDNDEKISSQKLQARLEAETTRAYEYFNSLNGVISTEEKDDIDRRLSDVKTKVNAASVLSETEQATSTKLFVEALGSTQKIISFMTNLDVRNNVKIEDLVPVTPTDDERRQTLESRLLEAEAAINQVETGITQLATTSSNYIELSEGLTEYKALQASASSSLAADDLSAAERSVTEALNLAEGLLNNLIALGVKIEVSTDTEDGVEND